MSDWFADLSTSVLKLGPLTTIAAGSGIAAIGAVIAVATHAMLIDITGGILTTTVAGITAAVLMSKRKSILSKFQQKIEEAKGEFRERLNADIEKLFESIFLELEHHLSEPLKEIDLKMNAVKPRIAEAELCKSAAEDIR
jgi:hypothetical protein